MNTRSIWYAVIVRDTQAREIVESCCTTDNSEYAMWLKDWRKEYRRDEGYRIETKQFYDRDAAFLFVGWTD